MSSSLPNEIILPVPLSILVTFAALSSFLTFSLFWKVMLKKQQAMLQELTRHNFTVPKEHTQVREVLAYFPHQIRM